MINLNFTLLTGHLPLFKIRSSVERANAHLKDWLLGGKIMVKGYKKVKYHLMCGVLCLAAIKVLQYLKLPEQKKL